MEVAPWKYLFFLAVLRLYLKGSKEIERMGKTFPKLIIYKNFRACIVLYLACTVDTNNLFIIHLFTVFQELEMLVHIFCVPNSMFTYRIIHLTFHAPQIVVCTCM